MSSLIDEICEVEHGTTLLALLANPLTTTAEFKLTCILDEAMQRWRPAPPEGKCRDAACTTMFERNSTSLLRMLNHKPLLPNAIVASIFQCIVCLGKSVPQSVLTTRCGELIGSLLHLVRCLDHSMARVGRVAARNFLRRVGPQLFTVDAFPADIIAWMTECLTRSAVAPILSRSTEALHGFEEDRRIAVFLLDKMLRVDQSWIGADLEQSVADVLEELEPPERVMAESFLRRCHGVPSANKSCPEGPSCPLSCVVQFLVDRDDEFRAALLQLINDIDAQEKIREFLENKLLVLREEGSRLQSSNGVVVHVPETETYVALLSSAV
jgi:hypothetical protein